MVNSQPPSLPCPSSPKDNHCPEILYANISMYMCAHAHSSPFYTQIQHSSPYFFSLSNTSCISFPIRI